MQSRSAWRFVAIFGCALANGRLLEQTNSDALHEVRQPEDDLITYEVKPEPWKGDYAVQRDQANEVAGQLASSELHAATGQAATALSVEAAVEKQLQATQSSLASKKAADEATQAAVTARMLRRRTEEVTKRIHKLVEEIPGKIKEAAERGTQEVVQAAITQMNQEARATADAALATDQHARMEAARKAQEAAFPFQQAKITAAETAVKYSAEAQQLANAVVQLRWKADQVAYDSRLAQSQGNVLKAQRMQLQARDLLDKASQYMGQAKQMGTIANQLNGQLGGYDLAASGAAAYAAYQSNPGGEPRDLPFLPRPLSLPPAGPSGAPGPAPGGAPGPAPAAAASSPA